MAGVNNSSNTSSAASSYNGHYWGLASGLDVDNIVSGLLTKQQAKIYKKQQQQQTLQWKQSAYRDIITKLNAFEKAYLKLGSKTSMATSDMYSAFATNCDNPALTVSANSDANGAAQIVKIKQSATTAMLSGSRVGGNITSGMSASQMLQNLKDYAAAADGIHAQEPAFSVTVDGVTKTISFKSSDLAGVSTPDQFKDLFNSKLSAAFGKVAPVSGGTAVCKVVAGIDGSGNLTIGANSASGYNPTVSVGSSGISFDARMLGQYTSQIASPTINVTYGGVTHNITFSSSDNLSSNDDILNTINAKLAAQFPSAGLKASTDSNGKLVIKDTAGTAAALTTNGSADQDALQIINSAPSMSVSYKDTSKTIRFFSGDNLADNAGIASTIAAKLAGVFPTDNLSAAFNGDGTLSIKDGTGTAASFKGNTGNVMQNNFGFSNGQNNRLDVNTTTLGQLSGITSSYDADGNIVARINDTDIVLGKPTDSVAAAFAKINASSAGVKIGYDATTDSITMSATQSGASGRVNIASDTSGFFGALKITQNDDTAIGRDAIINIQNADGTNSQDYTRDTNTFIISGVTYTINTSVTTDAPKTANVTFTQNSSGLKDGIKGFIDAYNGLLDALHEQTSTKPDKNYPPLTEAQKKGMTQTQIDDWNTKASKGMLFGDSTLDSLQTSLRSVLYKTVKGADGSDLSLYKMGITTSDDYADYGKLEIKTQDEKKFEEAVTKHADQIKELFTKSSNILLDISPTADPARQSQRKAEEGIVDHLDDIIKSVAGSVYGNKGSLLLIAGNVGDTTQYDNQIFSQLKDLNSTISNLQDQMDAKKKSLYAQFTKLESFMNRANAQTSMISSLSGR